MLAPPRQLLLESPRRFINQSSGTLHPTLLVDLVSLAGSRIAGQSAAAPKRTAASTSSPTSSRPFGDLAIGGAAIGTADDGKRSGEAGDDYHTETDDVTSGPDAHWEEDTSRIPRLEAITSVEARLPAAELNRYMNPSISHSIPAVRPSPIIRAKSSAKAPSSS